MLSDFQSDFQAMLGVTFFGVEFRVIALALLIALASVLFRSIIADLIFAGLRKLMIHQQKPWHDKLLSAIEQPVSMFVLTLGLAIALDTLPLNALWHHRVDMAFRVLVTIIVFWGFIRANNVGAEILRDYGQKRGLSMATFVPLFRQIVNVILVIIALIIIIDKLGYSVSSIIATLGIGGAALAFASQSTIANLYGSVAIALDRPFKVGDHVKIGATDGIVEAIGLRSTLIRTPQKTLVSIPNNTIANESIDNQTLMPARRIATTIGITYGTTQAQIEAILADLRAMMAGMNDKLLLEPQQAYLAAFADSSINLELLCFTNSADHTRFLEIRQEILLKTMRIVEKNGSALAFPTHTVHLVGPAAPTAKA